MRLYLALREAAAQRLFAHVPWLRSQLTAAVEAYAAGIHIDQSNASRRPRAASTPANPEAMQEALASGVFVPEDTPEQQAALARLETLLALVEGWVDDVVHARPRRAPAAADALRETMRRRRATGGPAERTFATLVGLELRPRRLREAAQLWDAVRERARHRGPRRALGAPRPPARTPRTSTATRRSQAFVRAQRRSTCPALDDLASAAGRRPGRTRGDGDEPPA